MRSEQPPVLARWLLRHLGSSPNNGAVLGDLNERYRNSRSPIWYWRQALGAIVTSFFHEVWDHKLQAVRALLTGWLVKAACLIVYSRTYAFPDRQIYFDGVEIPLFVSLVAIAAMMFSGWLIARTNRSHARAMVFLFVAVEWIALALTLSGIFIPYSSWISNFTRVIAAVFLHFQMIKGIAFAQLISVGITAASILIGGSLSTNHRSETHHAPTPA
jgi:hypothetical protein